MLILLNRIVASKGIRFLIYCYAFLAGVVLLTAIDIKLNYFAMLIGMSICFSVVLMRLKERLVRLLVLSIVFFSFGVLRYSMALPADGSRHISHYNEQKVELIGWVSAEPDVRIDGVRYILSLDSINGQEGIEGKVYLRDRLYPRYEYGMTLSLICTLKTPEPIESFRYDKYLARFGVFSICSRGRIFDVQETKRGGILKFLLPLKNGFANRINELWHEPYAGFMAGLLYGYRGGLGGLNDLFSTTGVTHIIAISGYNITIISTIILGGCIRVLINRKKAFWIVIFGIVVFVIFVGASASVVRAGVMGVLVLVARQMGRVSSVWNVLILTATIMTIHNPYILIWDAGFQLSFLSTVGLIYISPRIEKYFIWVPKKFELRESMTATMSATLITLPLILSQFKRISLVAVPTNVAILWIIPWIMLIGFVGVVLSIIWLPLGFFVSWLAWFGMKYVVKVVEWFAAIPYASLPVSISWVSLIIAYVAMAWWLKTRIKN